MIKKWLSWINLIVAGVGLALLFVAAIIALMRPSEIELIDVSQAKTNLPKGAFSKPKEAYDAIGQVLFDLKYIPQTLQLPDLKKQLIYYGKNGRPDASLKQPVLHFGFTGVPTLTSTFSEERLYIVYDKTKGTNPYSFSPDNQESTIWMEAIPRGNEVVIRLSMKDEQGEIIREPAQYAEFSLPEKEQVRVAGKTWELGKWRVDGGLLARQKARWVGVDRFLERHGGDEFLSYVSKQRIDFNDSEENTYSVYVSAGDSLIWDEDRWKLVQPGEQSLGHPLMVIKKVDERLMNCELWDVGGKSRLQLNLVRSMEPWTPQNIQENFVCLGARTRSQYIFEIDGQRMMLSPHDWILQTEEGWKKLTLPEEIDDYVERRHKGVLFVFDEVSRVNEKQVLQGVLFNTARSEMEPIEIVLQQSAGCTAESKNDDEDSDMESDDDEPMISADL